MSSKFTDLAAAASLASTDIVAVTVSPGVTPVSKKATVAVVRAAIVPIVLTADVSGTLPAGNGGTGITSLGSGVATFLGTPSGANLASALSSALPDTKGGTGLTSLGTGVATWLGTPSGANLASALTTALPVSKGGTGLTSIAAIAVSAMAIDWSLGSVFTKTLAAGANTFTFSNQASGMVIVVRVTGAASTLTWPTVLWAGGVAPTQTASGKDVYTFVHDGTDIYGSVIQAMA